MTYARDRGLPSHILSKILATIIHPNQLDQSSVRSAIDGLSPSVKMSSDDIYLIINSLGHGQKPPVATQNNLLRWVTRVWVYSDDTSMFDKLYSVLFNLIDSFGIRYIKSAVYHINV